MDATDTADFVLWDIPVPGGDGIPFFEGDFHGVECRGEESSVVL